MCAKTECAMECAPASLPGRQGRTTVVGDAPTRQRMRHGSCAHAGRARYTAALPTCYSLKPNVAPGCLADPKELSWMRMRRPTRGQQNDEARGRGAARCRAGCSHGHEPTMCLSIEQAAVKPWVYHASNNSASIYCRNGTRPCPCMQCRPIGPALMSSHVGSRFT